MLSEKGKILERHVPRYFGKVNKKSQRNACYHFNVPGFQNLSVAAETSPPVAGFVFSVVFEATVRIVHVRTWFNFLQQKEQSTRETETDIGSQRLLLSGQKTPRPSYQVRNLIFNMKERDTFLPEGT